MVIFSKFKNKNIFFLVFILLISLFFKTYQLQKLYQFDWDQERDAFTVSSIITERKPVLIGPRVVNDAGFFVGPFHYYFLLPFYLIFTLSPYAGAYASIFISLLSLLALYFVASKIFNPHLALIATFIISLAPTVVSWNVMYTPLFSIIIFYLCFLLANNNFRIFPLLIFIFFFSLNNHPAIISLSIPIFIAYLLSSRKISPKTLFLSLLVSALVFLPLVIFDLRHDFINSRSLMNFILNPKTLNSTQPWLFLRTFWRSLNFLVIPSPLFLTIHRLLVILMSLFGFLTLKDRKLKILISSWILTPLFLLAFYHGDIPEYYYSASLVVLPILLALFIARVLSLKYQLGLALILIILQISNIPSLFVGAPTLSDKFGAVSYLVHQQQDPLFNVSYELPLGMNSGYSYLFHYLKKEPQDTSDAHLYTIYIVNKNTPDGQIVYQNQRLGIVRR